LYSAVLLRFALQTLVKGADGQGRPGIFVAFEESTRQIVANAETFGWDLPRLELKQLYFLDARLSPDVVEVRRVIGNLNDIGRVLLTLANP
jgi:KaiC/GvpD/RAD55 family RecA-like ATPase